MFNAQGNSFDRAAVAIRVREALATWVAGGVLLRHAYPDPSEVLGVYGRLRAEVVAAGVAACVHPFPRDLQATLLGDMQRRRAEARATQRPKTAAGVREPCHELPLGGFGSPLPGNPPPWPALLELAVGLRGPPAVSA